MNLPNSIQLARQITSKRPSPEKIEKSGFFGVVMAQRLALHPEVLGRERCLELFKLQEYPKRIPAADIERLLAGKSAIKGLKIKKHPFHTTPFWQMHHAWVGDHEMALKVVRQDYASTLLLSAKDFVGYERYLKAVLRDRMDPRFAAELVKEEANRRIRLSGEIPIRQTLRTSSPHTSPLRFQEVYKDWSNDRMLAMDYNEGRVLDELLMIEEADYSTLRHLLSAFAHYMFTVGKFFNTDPRALMLDGKKIYPLELGRIYMLDQSAEGLKSLIRAVADGDYPKCASLANYLAANPLSGEAYEGFKSRFLPIFETEQGISGTLLGILELGKGSGMHFPPDLPGALEPLMHLERIAERCRSKKRFLKDFARYLDHEDDGDSGQGQDGIVSE